MLEGALLQDELPGVDARPFEAAAEDLVEHEGLWEVVVGTTVRDEGLQGVDLVGGGHVRSTAETELAPTPSSSCAAFTWHFWQATPSVAPSTVCCCSADAFLFFLRPVPFPFLFPFRVSSKFTNGAEIQRATHSFPAKSHTIML